MNDAARRFPGMFRLAFAAVLFALAIPFAAQADCRDWPAPAVYWTGCSKERLMLDGSDLTAGIFEGALLSGTGFKGALLAGANLQRSELERSSFIGADLTDADLSSGDFYRNDFSDAQMTGANLRDAIMPRTVFTGR